MPERPTHEAPNKPIAVPQRVIQVLRILSAAAEAGSRCPTNADIADLISAESTATAARVVKLLETMGLITVRRGGMNRSLTIASTGKSTAPITGPAHWRERKLGRVYPRPPKPRPGDGEPISAIRVDRDPCGFCGTRRDIGCRHHPLETAA